MSADLEHFLQSQDDGSVARARQELSTGRKRSHWMWFVFPQLAGLGSSAMAERYALRGRDHAAAYEQHPVLGERLRDLVQVLLDLPADLSAHDVFSSPDDLKLRSSMTLFREVAHEPSPYQAVLDRWYDGEPDPRTLALLARADAEERSRNTD